MNDINLYKDEELWVEPTLISHSFTMYSRLNTLPITIGLIRKSEAAFRLYTYLDQNLPKLNSLSPRDKAFLDTVSEEKDDLSEHS